MTNIFKGTNFKRLLDIIYPKRCELCGDVLYFGEDEYVCSKCMERLDGYEKPVVLCDEGFCVFRYEGDIRKAILGLKYFGDKGAGKAFGSIMYRCCVKCGFCLDFDLILAVAASKKRISKRGYNQADIIAEEFGALSGIPVGKGLIRKRDTKPQNKLNREERAENVKNAFYAEGSFKGKKILLIDDIYTTGSTVRECSKALYDAGAEKVCYGTAAASLLE